MHFILYIPAFVIAVGLLLWLPFRGSRQTFKANTRNPLAHIDVQSGKPDPASLPQGPGGYALLLMLLLLPLIQFFLHSAGYADDRISNLPWYALCAAALITCCEWLFARRERSATAKHQQAARGAAFLGFTLLVVFYYLPHRWPQGAAVTIMGDVTAMFGALLVRGGLLTLMQKSKAAA